MVGGGLHSLGAELGLWLPRRRHTLAAGWVPSLPRGWWPNPGHLAVKGGTSHLQSLEPSGEWGDNHTPYVTTACLGSRALFPLPLEGKLHKPEG